MPQPINEGAVEYEDGTSPTVTQMAKDVCVFLTWAAEPEADERKLMGELTPPPPFPSLAAPCQPSPSPPPPPGPPLLPLPHPVPSAPPPRLAD